MLLSATTFVPLLGIPEKDPDQTVGVVG